LTFNSIQFALFFLVVVFVYAPLHRHDRTRNCFLLLASYFFYMQWNWKYAGLIALSTVIDYFAAGLLQNEMRQARRKALLLVSLTMNLGLLGLFKYYNFFAGSGNSLLTTMGVGATLPYLDVLLPVGISFYTFQTMSYSIDVYRRVIPAERDFIKFAVFVSFFPQLVAGPIVRAKDFLPQLQQRPPLSESRFTTGLWLVMRGLFKKVVIADMLAMLAVDRVFADPGAFGGLDLLLALYGYSFQIYNDFSGYSDVAIGLARILGFDLAVNFNRPYLALNVRDFWTRWHISLSGWLRDYLYIALGGNRGTRFQVTRNLMLTMLLGGLWHGAAWNFVLWGGWHGLLLALSRGTTRVGGDYGLAGRLWRRVLTFHLIAVSWLLFRVSDLADLGTYLRGLCQWGAPMAVSPLYLAILICACVLHFTPTGLPDRLGGMAARQPLAFQGLAVAGMFWLLVGMSIGAPAFIYFQF
jgi:alginate O-acetyltransferase complex protein AlgI